MHVVGVDLSANMMEKALAKGYESIHQRDISKDDIGECLGKFDALVSVGVFGEWVSAERRLDALLPALKSSCRLGITMETEHSDLDAVSSILKSHGFSILMSARGPGWHDPQYPPEDYFFVIASRD
jgi:cyclopropane fatty-acyl-phospholipid synthase-like methyltransferase